MKDKPLVTVICLCYNQRPFLKPAIQSVLDQTYENVELIVVDDASQDGSQDLIENIVASHPGIKYFLLEKNLGNCKAFNYGLKHAKGEYIIDLAGDDILKPTRIEVGVKGFIYKGTDYGVNFSDADLIDEEGRFLTSFYKETSNGKKPAISEGNVYIDLLERYFICPPTLMSRKSLFDKLGGYDENLAYEDFDFLLRVSRISKFFYTDKSLVKRRIVTGSMSSKQYKRGSQQLYSTFRILEKVKDFNKERKEKRAFKKRVRYEARKVLQVGEIKLFIKYIKLLFK